MKANYDTMNRCKARKIAQEEVAKAYNDIFRDCSSDVMHQTLANVLLCLERDYGWKRKRLTAFISNLQGWCDIMDSPAENMKAWTTIDNIDYFKRKYGIDLRTEFEADISKNPRKG